MCLPKIILIRKVSNMENKVLNEYYKDYLKKVSKDNIQKYNEERRDKNNNSEKKDNKK